MENVRADGPRYFPVYSEVQEILIKADFSRLKDQCYLEHAGATLYSERQISNILSDLTTNTYGNPHARSASSKLTEDVIDQIRYGILRHFNTIPDDYTVIFTSGATASLKLVAENFQYNGGTFVYLTDNHTSVLGMREYADTSVPLNHKDAFEVLASKKRHSSSSEDEEANSLFVYPAQCNFSGAKYPLSWAKEVKNGRLNGCGGIKTCKRWFCMVDAACFASTNFLDLSRHQPDFVCLSFYKIFGYPTGLGALLVKNSSASVLEKKYFGGGTVLMALSSERTHVPREVLYERFEDGTLPFLSIIALRHGFAALDRFRLSMNNIAIHTFALAQFVFRRLGMLHHSNGTPAVVFYHDNNFESITHQGGIINFNLLRPSGEYIGYAEVLHIANLYGIHLRTGCFCNPGACQRHLGLSTNDIKSHFKAGHVCGDQNDLINGHPTGSVRVSFGYMTLKKDADTFLGMIEECFVQKPIIKKPRNGLKYLEDQERQEYHPSSSNCEPKRDLNTMTCDINDTYIHRGTLKMVFVYPVKSCGAFRINSSWELTNTGLKYDRQWMIVNANGVCLTQKTEPRLCLIKPVINIREGVLRLQFENEPTVSVPLNSLINKANRVRPFKCQSKVCGDMIQGWDCGDKVAGWLSEVLSLPGARLLTQCNEEDEIGRSSKGNQLQLSLVNQAQFLLINTASVSWLLSSIPSKGFDSDLDLMIGRFRPNLVVDFQQPFVENSCAQFKIGEKLSFKKEGQCTRCQMICINQSTGEKSVEPLKTLSREFNGKIAFGVYLSNGAVEMGCKLKLGDEVNGFPDAS